jgi:hypothetical protein
VVEHHLDMVVVGGSIPLAPTKNIVNHRLFHPTSLKRLSTVRVLYRHSDRVIQF